MTRPGRLDLLLGLALVGVAIASYLSWTALDKGQEVACGPLGDCHTVQNSRYAEVAGVPVAVLGLGVYVGLVALLSARRWYAGSPAIFATWTFALALSGALYSGYLTYLELFEIDAICAWCVTSAALMAVIFVLSLPDATAGRSPEEVES